MSRRALVVVTVTLGLLLTAEAGVRARAASMPDPLRWSAPEMQYKESQVDARARRGGASVVFLGSSVVDAGVDPTLITIPPGHRPAYNAANGGGSIGMIDTWARRVAVPRLKPDTVVLGLISRELNPNDPEQARLERDFRAAPAVKRLEGTEGVLERSERRLERWSDLFKYRTLLRQPKFFANVLGVGDAPTRHTRSTTTADDGQYQGFLALHFDPDPRINAVFRTTALARYRIGDEQLIALRHLLGFLGPRATRVVVVAMPVTAQYAALHPRGRADNDDFVRVLGREATAAGAQFVDAGVWPEALFADAAHLNRAGARRLSTLLDGELGPSFPLRPLGPGPRLSSLARPLVRTGSR